MLIEREEHQIRRGMIGTAMRAAMFVLVVSWGASADARPSGSDASSSGTRPTSQEIEKRVAPRGNVVTAADRQVLQKLHDANQTQIQMGELAQGKGSAKAVRDLARQLIAEHTRAEKMIGDYLRRRGLDPSMFATTTRPDPEHEVLAAKFGLAFERAFAAQAATDHQKVLNLLETARNDTADDELMTLFDQLKTTERAHKRAAQAALADPRIGV
jgi:putative membrane protein